MINTQTNIMRGVAAHIITLFLAFSGLVAWAREPVVDVDMDTVAQPVNTVEVSYTIEELESFLAICRTRLDSTTAALEQCALRVSSQDDSIAI